MTLSTPLCVRTMSYNWLMRRRGATGYGHSIYLHKDFCRAAFATAAEDIRTFIRRVETSLAGPWGKRGTLPIAHHDRIGFNDINPNCVCSGSDPQDATLCPPACLPGEEYPNEAWGFWLDFRTSTPMESWFPHHDAWWFECHTDRRPYDKVVMLALLALKHHLGQSVEVTSRGRWPIEWGAGYDWPPSQRYRRVPQGAVETYEHVFPGRAPVQNILNREGEDFWSEGGGDGLPAQYDGMRVY